MRTPAQQPRSGDRKRPERARGLHRAARTSSLIVLLFALGSLGAQSARADVGGPQIVGFLNAQRAAQGVPAGIVHDAALSAGCANHNNYGRVNGVLVHSEDPALQGYTAAGDQAARTSVLYQGGGPWSAARNPFETAPIHLHQLLAPRLDRMGASEDLGYGCATTLASRSRAAPATDSTYTYPGPGATAWPFAQTASEGPYTPGQQVGIPAGTKTGPYLYVMFDGPTVTLSDTATATSATLTDSQGATVSVATADNNTTGLVGFLPTGMQVIPRAQLAPSTTYTANVSASVTTQGGGGPARSFSRTWSFTTDSLPDTAIDSGPSGTVTVRTASFGFSSTKAGSTFQCRLDTGAWNFCTSPASLGGLADGTHTWAVRAVDAAGNTDPTDATRTWTVAGPAAAPPPMPAPPASPLPRPPGASLSPLAPAPVAAISGAAPTATLSGRRSQRLARTVRVGVACIDQPCVADATGSVRIPKTARRRTRHFTLKNATAVLAKHDVATLRPALSAAARRAIRAALRRGTRITINLKVGVANGAGKRRTLTRQVRLRL